MELEEKANQLPGGAGVYLFKDALGKIIYVGKAKSPGACGPISRRAVDAKTGSLMREAADVENHRRRQRQGSAGAENNLIKQYWPWFNVLLRDDKTYPYIRFTAGEKFPRVYVTRRLKKDGSEYFGPYFPGRLAYRIVELIHRTFKVPSCTVDLTRRHPRPCLQYYIKRCHGPCVAGLVADERYAEAARHTRLFSRGNTATCWRS
jgi:excinuclease ABC subunit C